MPRSTRSDVESLLQEARALEMVANEAEVSPDRIQEYWAIATDLITLVTDIEELEAVNADAGYDDPSLLALRRRLREIASRLTELSLE